MTNLPEMRPEATQFDDLPEPFHRWHSADETEWLSFHRDNGDFVLRFPGLADFRIGDGGDRSSCTPVPGTDQPTVEHLWLNQVQPLIRSMGNDMVFHAGCVEVEGGAIALLGASGRGKSTLTASFALAGQRFLSDDLLVLQIDEDGIYALPSHPTIRIWQDSRDELIGPDAVPVAGVSYTTKEKFPAAEKLPHCDTRKRLLAAFFIEADEPEMAQMREMRGVEKVARWVENLFLLDIDNPARLQAALDKATQVARAVPSIALSYPRTYPSLAETRSAILERVNEDGASR